MAGPSTGIDPIRFHDAHDLHDNVVSHGLAKAEPQNLENVIYFWKGKAEVFGSEVVNHERTVIFRFVTADGQSTTMYDGNDNPVAVIEWDTHPIIKYEGQEMKLKNWIARKPNNTGPIMTHNGHMYEWVQEQFYAVVRSSPDAERKAVIFNDRDLPALEMLPEGTADGLLMPIVLLTALTECGLVKGHGFPGTGEDTISGHIIESFLGVGSQLKKAMHLKKKGGEGHDDTVSPSKTNQDGEL